MIVVMVGHWSFGDSLSMTVTVYVHAAALPLLSYTVDENENNAVPVATLTSNGVLVTPDDVYDSILSTLSTADTPRRASKMP